MSRKTYSFIRITAATITLICIKLVFTAQDDSRKIPLIPYDKKIAEELLVSEKGDLFLLGSEWYSIEYAKRIENGTVFVSAKGKTDGIYLALSSRRFPRIDSLILRKNSPELWARTRSQHL